MGLFDLGDYWQKKVRADKSATPPRTFPAAFADVFFDGRRQKLRFEPTFPSGGVVYVSFRPADAPPERALICGGGTAPWTTVQCFPEYETSGDPHALIFWSEDASGIDGVGKWLVTAVAAVESGQFGRLIVEEKGGEFVYNFFGSAGNWDMDEQISYEDGDAHFSYAPKSIDFDWSEQRKYWATKETAAELLIRLDAVEFALYLEGEKAKPRSVYGLSYRWPELSYEERCSYLPRWEKENGHAIKSLMRAVVWSDVGVGRGEVGWIPRWDYWGDGNSSEPAFWRRPRLWNIASEDVGEVRRLTEKLGQRIASFWPYINAHFKPSLESVKWSEIHPIVDYWMNFQGGYVIEFAKLPNAHEHLEARLLLRDFLSQTGVSLEEVEAGLRDVGS